MMDIEALRTDFTHLYFERIDPARNEYRFYYLGWQRTLFHAGAVVRIAGRLQNGHQRILAPLPYRSLDEAWYFIRATIRKRLRNGYTIVGHNYPP